MIGYGLKLRVEESFDTTSKRFQYRKAINDRYKFVFTRKDKGHITGAYQSALSVNKDRVINLLRHGQFATHGLLNLEGRASNRNKFSWHRWSQFYSYEINCCRTYL